MAHSRGESLKEQDNKKSAQPSEVAKPNQGAKLAMTFFSFLVQFFRMFHIFKRLKKKKKKKPATVLHLPLSEIHPNPYQPRREYTQESLSELAESIRMHGVLQPIIVRKAENGYEVVSGERRLRASELAEKKSIPAILGEFSDGELMEIALLENLQRKDLTILEESLGYGRLQDVYKAKSPGSLSEAISHRLGKKSSEVKEKLAILDYSPLLQKALEKRLLSLNQAQVLAPFEGTLQKMLLARIVRAQASEEKLASWARELQASSEVQEESTREFVRFLQVAIEAMESFGWGIAMDIQRDSEKTKIEILLKHAAEPPRPPSGPTSRS